ncbi:nucleoside-diphosphate kinase [Sphaerisporangium corydalis]|uniref:Nucleoside-diphosphate kinase n=1 Tax=Sphaerisporangium corydalis TaxID=1441875 RepID=A0ABV9EH15_9ACTN|nr:nucleoside-diphosphate kinase [Sphaerisporangium corydalis]
MAARDLTDTDLSAAANLSEPAGTGVDPAALARYERDPDFRRGLGMARGGGEVLRSTALLLLPPLCVTTGRVPAALEWLGRNGFQVIYAGLRHLDATHIERVWKYQIGARDPVRVQVFADLMTCGPSVVLGLFGQAADGVSAAARLKGLKGPADPRRAAPHHLRTRLGAANLLNNLAHTSDGPAEVVRESAAILGDHDATALWEAAGQALAAAPPKVDVLDLLPPATDQRDGISLAHVCVGMRARIITDIQAMLDPGHSALMGPDGSAPIGLDRFVPTDSSSSASADPDRSALAEVVGRVSVEERWAEDHDPVEPLVALADFQRRFRPVLGAVERATRHRRTSDAVRLDGLLALFGAIEAALFGAPFDFGHVVAAARTTGFPLGTRDRMVLATEWVCRAGLTDTRALRPASVTGGTV